MAVGRSYIANYTVPRNPLYQDGRRVVALELRGVEWWPKGFKGFFPERSEVSICGNILCVISPLFRKYLYVFP